MSRGDVGHRRDRTLGQSERSPSLEPCRASAGVVVSFDLSFWYEDMPSTPERAAEIDDRLNEGEDGVVPSTPALDDFFAEIIATFGDLTEENMDESPWTSSLYRSAECVMATLDYSRCAEIAPALRQLASKHGLTTYDPQNRKVYPPAGS